MPRMTKADLESENDYLRSGLEKAQSIIDAALGYNDEEDGEQEDDKDDEDFEDD